MGDILEKNIKSWTSWLEFEKRVSKNTVISYKSDLISFLRFLKEYENQKVSFESLKFIDEKTIVGWFYYRIKKNISQRSNARALSSIKNFFEYLKKQNSIKSSKILAIKSPKFQESLPRPLSFKQVEKIFFNFTKDGNNWIRRRNQSIFLLMWGYGLRISEVLNIKLKNIKYTEFILVKSKGKKDRSLPILPELKQYIFKMLNEVPFCIKDEDYIFLGKRGKKLNPVIIQRELSRIRREQLLPENTTPHSLRHTFATQLLDNKVDLRSIQELLGHKSLSTTQKYTAVDVSKIRETIDNFHPRSKK
tara:strand:- start:251 stop:1165 length:915 start_codon:yes stop_codon:yes gene_type:complete